MDILTLTGPSCSGKTTLLNKLVEQHGFASIVSHTTRPMRSGEIHGKDYYFTTKETFDEMLSQGKFIEHVEFSGYMYGVSVPEIERATAEGKTAVLIVEPIGLQQIKTIAKSRPDLSVHSFYINGNLQDLVQRYLQRAQDEDFSKPDVAARHARRIISLTKEHRDWYNGSEMYNLYDSYIEYFNEKSEEMAINMILIGLDNDKS